MALQSNLIQRKIIWPPERVKMMKILNKEMFRKSIQVPFVVANTQNLNEIKAKLNDHSLKMPGFKPNQKIEESNKHKIYLNPEIPEDRYLSIINKLENAGLLSSFENKILNHESIELTYENFNHVTILRSILPDEIESLTGYSHIGHLIHLNLRDHHLPYKNIIGEILVDKIKGCRMVINKLDIIESEFRNFQMEILAQDSADPPPTTVVSTSECKATFKFDFAKVYWNPRLNTERLRIVKKLQKEIDTVYDVFAGVGPFSLAAAKLSKCRVLANDLNPDAYHWLVENVKNNKVENLVQCFNEDGRYFISTHIKADLLQQSKDFDGTDLNRKFHVLMNLPDIAFEFLDEFPGLLRPKNDDDVGYRDVIHNLQIHCYCFVKDLQGDPKDHLIEKASAKLDYKLNPEDVEEVVPVRSVAPNKIMYRLSFKLNDYLLYEAIPKAERLRKNAMSGVENEDENDQKRKKLKTEKLTAV